MKNFLCTLLLTSATAQAAPLLGTAHSFFESTFCARYGCALSSREPLGGGAVDFRYTLKPEMTSTPGAFPDVGPTLSVIRTNAAVTSIGFATGAQDSLLYPGSSLARVLAQAFTLAAGAAVSEAALGRLEAQCGAADSREARLQVGRFTVSCVNTTGEYVNARRVAFRIYR